MSLLEEFAEAVAVAKREVTVAEALEHEYRGKLRMAEEELGHASRRLHEAQLILDNAAVDLNEAAHGKPVSFEDRMDFEKRWDARIKAAEEKKAASDHDRTEENKARKKLMVEVKQEHLASTFRMRPTE